MTTPDYFTRLEESISHAAEATTRSVGSRRVPIRVAMMAAAVLAVGLVAMIVRDPGTKTELTTDPPPGVSTTEMSPAPSSTSQPDDPPPILNVDVARRGDGSPLAFQLDLEEEPPEGTWRLVVLVDGVFAVDATGGPFSESPIGFGSGSYPDTVLVQVQALDREGGVLAATPEIPI